MALHPNWQQTEKELRREFEFKDFNEAFAFMTSVALLAEAQNHHPWWANVWSKVEIRLSTHDAGDIVTEKDLLLAESIDKVAARYVA